MDSSMVLLTVIFLVIFVVPFFVISAVKQRKAKKENMDSADKAA